MYSEGPSTPQQTAAYIRAQLDEWGRIVREIGLQPEEVVVLELLRLYDAPHPV